MLRAEERVKKQVEEKKEKLAEEMKNREDRFRELQKKGQSKCFSNLISQKKKLKEKAQNRMVFMHYEATDNERPTEEEKDDLLIKRAYANWSKLKTPAYY